MLRKGLFAGDHSAWGRATILEMLGKFLAVTQAITLPDLEEYHWRSDKVSFDNKGEATVNTSAFACIARVVFIFLQHQSGF